MKGKNNVMKLISKPVISLRHEIYLILGLVESYVGQAQQERWDKKKQGIKKWEKIIFLHT